MNARIPGFDEVDVPTGRGVIRCRVGGNPGGPPVLLRHGWAGTGYSWRRCCAS